MNMMRAVLALVAAISCTAGISLAGVERVRIYSARPDVFEYMFASIAAGSDTAAPQLSFNNLRTGRTTFAKVGEKVGDYRIQSFTPRTETFLNERTSREETRKSGTAVLASEIGQTVALEMGKALPTDGFVAWLVDLDSGGATLVRPGDSIVFAGVTQRVDGVSLQQVRVSVGGEPKFLVPATEEERAGLSAIWTRQREAWEEAKRRADERSRKEAEAREQEAMRTAFESTALQGYQPPAQSARRPSGTQISVVTEYRYPTDYEVIPPVYDSRGNMIRPLVVIPRNFVTRPVGVTMGGGGSTFTVIQDTRGSGGGTTSVTGGQ